MEKSCALVRIVIFYNFASLAYNLGFSCMIFWMISRYGFDSRFCAIVNIIVCFFKIKKLCIRIVKF